jgi:hypothetical protein
MTSLQLVEHMSSADEVMGSTPVHHNRLLYWGCVLFSSQTLARRDEATLGGEHARLRHDKGLMVDGWGFLGGGGGWKDVPKHAVDTNVHRVRSNPLQM